MKSMVCEGVTVGEGTIVAEQSLIRKGTTIPGGKIVSGSPAKVIGNTADRHKAFLSMGIQAYMDLVKQYHQSFARVDKSFYFLFSPRKYF